MAHLLGIDVGTSATKALLCDENGKVIATTSSPHKLIEPQIGWTEQNPDDWWNATRLAIKAVLRGSRAKADSIRAIGLSGQMHGSVFLDREAKVIRPALLWNDQRVSKQCDDILHRVGGARRMLQLVGNLPMTGYTSPKILWLREKEPKHFSQLKKIILPKDYIRLKLTGVLASDVADASGMALVNQKTRTWSIEMLKALDLDADLLPELFESQQITGGLLSNVARGLGLKAGTPVIAGAGDVMCGAIGNGIVESGIINAGLGTSGVMVAHADSPILDDQGPVLGRVATMCSAVPNKWVVYGCMLSAAGSLGWFADEIGQLEQLLAVRTKKDVFEILDQMAGKSQAGSHGLFFLPYLTGERCPHPDPSAQGAWIGLTRGSTRADLVRAVMEGVTFNMNAILRILREGMKLQVKQVRCTGGGAKSKLWRSMQADIYNAPLAITNSNQGSAFGAALLAGVGAGLWKSVEEACRKTISVVSIDRPNPSRAENYAKRQRIFDRLYFDLRERFQEISALG